MNTTNTETEMMTKIDEYRRSREQQIEKLQTEIQLREAISRNGLKETLLALVEEYSLTNVEEFLKRIANGKMKRD